MSKCENKKFIQNISKNDYKYYEKFLIRLNKN